MNYFGIINNLVTFMYFYKYKNVIKNNITEINSYLIISF